MGGIGVIPNSSASRLISPDGPSKTDSRSAGFFSAPFISYTLPLGFSLSFCSSISPQIVSIIGFILVTHLSDTSLTVVMSSVEKASLVHVRM